MQLNADLKSVDEDKDRAFAKLNDEIKAKEDLHGESTVHRRSLQLELAIVRHKQVISKRLQISYISLETRHWCNFVVCVTLFFPLESIKELESEKLSLQTDAEHYSDQVTDLNFVLVWFLFFNDLVVHFHLLICLFVCPGPKITTETPHYDRNVPGEWAQAAQVQTHRLMCGDVVSANSSATDERVCPQAADSGGEGASAEGREVE